MDYEAFGKHVREQRHRIGVTQADMAKLIGISQAFYGNLERGSRKPSVETLVLLANTFGVSTDTLLADSLLQSGCKTSAKSIRNMLVKDVSRIISDNIGNWLSESLLNSVIAELSSADSGFEDSGA